MRATTARATVLAGVLVLATACTDADPGGVGAASDAERSSAPSAATSTSAPEAPSSSDHAGDPTPSPAATKATRCAPSVDVSRTAAVDDPSLDEISGAVASRRHDDVVWLHEDSGNPAQLTAVTLDGNRVSRTSLTGVTTIDWEDLAAATDPNGRSMLFVGDVGDNLRARDTVEIHRLVEPDPTAGDQVVPAEVLRLRLPSPTDVEALIVDPTSGDVVLVGKDLSGRAEVLEAPGAAWEAGGSAPIEVRSAGALELGALRAVLAGDLSPDGTTVALRTPDRVLVWDHGGDRSVADTLLATTPCTAAAVLDPFGEALALLPGGGHLLTGESGAPELVVVVP